MRIPADYPDILADELAPFGFAFASMLPWDDGDTRVLFEADPESFVRAHPGLGIEQSYPEAWPPARLHLWLAFDRHGDPVVITFEVFDLLAWAASADPELHAALSTITDPVDHAVAVGEAMQRLLEQESGPTEEYFD